MMLGLLHHSSTLSLASTMVKCARYTLMHIAILCFEQRCLHSNTAKRLSPDDTFAVDTRLFRQRKPILQQTLQHSS
jgi:hypothetical protein